MNLLEIATRLSGDVIPIEKHKNYRHKSDPKDSSHVPPLNDGEAWDDGDDVWVNPDPVSFKFKSVGAPNKELEYLGYDLNTIEAIDHISQLSSALSKGDIGFEWFIELSKQEFKKAGW